MSVSFSSPQNDALTLTQCLRYLKTELMQSDGETRGLNNFEEPSESTLPPWVLFIPIGHVRARVLAVYGHMHAFLCSCNKVLIKKKEQRTLVSTIATFTNHPLCNKWEGTLG